MFCFTGLTLINFYNSRIPHGSVTFFISVLVLVYYHGIVRRFAQRTAFRISAIVHFVYLVRLGTFYYSF